MQGSTSQTRPIEISIPVEAWRDFVGEIDAETLRKEYGGNTSGFNDEIREYLLREAVAPLLAEEIGVDPGDGEDLYVTEKGDIALTQGRDPDSGQFEKKR
jgi:hypothetical protein